MKNERKYVKSQNAPLKSDKEHSYNVTSELKYFTVIKNKDFANICDLIHRTAFYTRGKEMTIGKSDGFRIDFKPVTKGCQFELQNNSTSSTTFAKVLLLDENGFCDMEVAKLAFLKCAELVYNTTKNKVQAGSAQKSVMVSSSILRKSATKEDVESFFTTRLQSKDVSAGVGI